MPREKPQERTDRLFHEACEKPIEVRSDFLDLACEGEPEIRAEVERLLDADAELEANDRALPKIPLNEVLKEIHIAVEGMPDPSISPRQILDNQTTRDAPQEKPRSVKPEIVDGPNGLHPSLTANTPVELLYIAAGYRHYAGSCCSPRLDSSEIVSPSNLTHGPCEDSVPRVEVTPLPIPPHAPGRNSIRLPEQLLVVPGDSPADDPTEWGEKVEALKVAGVFAFTVARGADGCVEEFVARHSEHLFEAYFVQYRFQREWTRYLRFIECGPMEQPTSLPVYRINSLGGVAILVLKDVLSHRGEFCVVCNDA